MRGGGRVFNLFQPTTGHLITLEACQSCNDGGEYDSVEATTLVYGSVPSWLDLN